MKFKVFVLSLCIFAGIGNVVNAQDNKRVSPKIRLRSSPVPVLRAQFSQSEQEERNISDSSELTSESLDFGIEGFSSGIGMPVHEKVEYGVIVIHKSINDRLKGISGHLFDLIEPSGQFGPCHVFDAFPVEDVRQLHGELISPLQFGIELEDDVRPPSLGFCPFGLVFGQNVFGPC